jgi:hypothetical protein
MNRLPDERIGAVLWSAVRPKRLRLCDPPVKTSKGRKIALKKPRDAGVGISQSALSEPQIGQGSGIVSP